MCLHSQLAPALHHDSRNEVGYGFAGGFTFSQALIMLSICGATGGEGRELFRTGRNRRVRISEQVGDFCICRAGFVESLRLRVVQLFQTVEPVSFSLRFSLPDAFL
jgi:hypothetical protein